MFQCDAYEPEWQQAFFGVHYPRLHKIKLQYDPNGILWCRRCVGSEAWIEEDDGKLCWAGYKEGEDENGLSKRDHKWRKGNPWHGSSGDDVRKRQVPL